MCVFHFHYMTFPLFTANCSPPCKNGGMCLRPHMCVCKPGSKGKSCEQTTLPPTGPLNGHTKGGLPYGGHTNGYGNGHNVIPQRPIPQQTFPQGQGQVPLPLPGTSVGHMTLPMKPSNGPIPYQPQWVWMRSVISNVLLWLSEYVKLNGLVLHSKAKKMFASKCILDWDSFSSFTSLLSFCSFEY